MCQCLRHEGQVVETGGPVEERPGVELPWVLGVWRHFLFDFHLTTGGLLRLLFWGLVGGKGTNAMMERKTNDLKLQNPSEANAALIWGIISVSLHDSCTIWKPACAYKVQNDYTFTNHNRETWISGSLIYPNLIVPKVCVYTSVHTFRDLSLDINIGISSNLIWYSCINTHIHLLYIHISIQYMPLTYLLLWRCPPLSQTPGCRCCHRYFLPGHCHCSDLRGQAAPSHGHVNHYTAHTAQLTANLSQKSKFECYVLYYFYSTLQIMFYAYCAYKSPLGCTDVMCSGLTARTRASVKVGKKWVQLIRTEQGVPTKLCCSCCRPTKIRVKI